jgi:hypothetical protein
MASKLELPNQPVLFETIHMRLPNSSVGHSQSQKINAALRRPKLKLEPIKLLEPCNRKLTLPESQRIIYIIEELIKKVEMLDYMNVILSNPNSINDLLNEDELLIDMLNHHKTLIEAYDQNLSNNKHENENKQRASFSQNRETLESLIKSSCRDIFRMFNKKPILFESVKNQLRDIKPKNSYLTELLSKLLS